MRKLPCPSVRAMASLFAFFIGMVVCGSTRAADEQNGVFPRESQLLWRWHDLNAAHDALSRGPITTSWDAGVFISRELMRDVLEIQKGSTITINGVRVIGSANLQIEKVSLLDDHDHPAVRLNLLATTPFLPGVSFPVEADALLVYRRTALIGDEAKPGAAVKPATEAKPHMFFGIRLVRWRSGVRLGQVNLGQTPKPISAFQAEAFMHFFGQKLELPIPLEASIPINLKELVENIALKPIEVKKTGESFALELSYPLNPPLRVNAGTPLHVPGGIWLLAAHQLPVGPPEWAANDVNPTEASVKALAAKVNRLRRQNTPVIRSDLAAFVRPAALEALLDAFKQPAMRTVRLLAPRGAKLFNENTPFGVHVLVEGGRGKDAFLDAFSVVDMPTLKWSAAGMRFDAPLTFSGRANLHTYFKPPNLGSDFRPKVSGATHLGGVLRLTYVEKENEGGPLVLLIPTMQCVNLHLEIADPGAFKFLMRAGALLFEKPLKPLVLMDGVPKRFDFELRYDAPKLPEMSLKFVPATRFVSVTAAPTTAGTTAAGFWLEGNVTLTPADPDETRFAEARKPLADAATKRLASFTKTLKRTDQCPKQELPRFEVLGIEIGPNGEIRKVIEWLTKEAGKAAKEFDEAKNRFAQEAEKTTKRIVTEAAKSLEHVGKEAEKGVAHLGNEASKGLKKAGKAMGSAFNDGKEAIKKW